jgi:signal peptide peptidase SppA
MAALDAAVARSQLDQFLDARARDLSSNANGSGFFPMANDGGKLYELRPGGVARIGWDGPMYQRPHPILRAYLGYVDTAELDAAVRAASADPQVKAVMLVVNSPGGAIPGVAELSASITEAAGSKPVVAITEESVGSAAYWAVSGCSNIYGTGPVVSAGSIGVVMVHVYSPRTDGAVVSEITAGKYKRVISSHKPLSSEGAADLQEKVDYLTQQFVNAVAVNRRLSAASVAAQEGRTYIGQQAIDAGLLDGFMRVEELERQLAADPARFMKRKAVAGRLPAKASAPNASTTWPPKLQPVASTASPESVLEQTGQAEQDLRADAAEIVRMHRLTTGRMPMVMNWKGWERAGAARATKDGCTLVEGLKREGYLHPYVSLPDSPKRGAPGVKPVVQLTRQQMAERATAWAQFRGCSVLDACKWLGLKS